MRYISWNKKRHLRWMQHRGAISGIGSDISGWGELQSTLGSNKTGWEAPIQMMMWRRTINLQGELLHQSFAERNVSVLENENWAIQNFHLYKVFQNFCSTCCLFICLVQFSLFVQFVCLFIYSIFGWFFVCLFFCLIACTKKEEMCLFTVLAMPIIQHRLLSASLYN